MELQPVFPHYRPSYTAHLSAPISHILFKHLHSPHNIQAQDIFTYSDETERLRTYVLYNENAYKMFIQMMGRKNAIKKNISSVPQDNAKHKSPQCSLQKIRRMKQLQKDEYSSKSSDVSFISFSKSYMPNNSNGDYLESHLSQKSISQMTQFQLTSYNNQGSLFEIYQPVDQSDMESQLNAYRKKAQGYFNQWLMLSGVKRLAPIEEKDPALIQTLKQPTQSEISHLILKQKSVLQQEQKIPQKQKVHNNLEKLQKQSKEEQEQSNEQLISPLSYLVQRNLPLSIKKQVYKQLCKYSWMGVTQNERPVQRQKKIRQKAEELLINMGHNR